MATATARFAWLSSTNRIGKAPARSAINDKIPESGNGVTDVLDELDSAWQSPTPQLGANPQALCYISGFGARSPRWPLSKLSQYDGVAEPLRGIPVLGPHWHVPSVSPQMRAVNAIYDPPSESDGRQPRTDAEYRAAYPALRRFTDSDSTYATGCSWAGNEIARLQAGPLRSSRRATFP